jgi:hypothetical protein
MAPKQRRGALDAQSLRHRLRFGEFEAALTDADAAQLHDKLLHLHACPDESVCRLCGTLRSMVEHHPHAPDTLELGAEAARQVQVAVYAEQTSRRRVSPTLAHARLQAFNYLESLSP